MEPDKAVGKLTAAAPMPTRAGQAYLQLRAWILHGELEPGRKLDQEWLSATLNLSRTPLRHALLMLESDGLVEQRPYQGAVVAPLSRDAVEDVYATRQVVEGLLAFQATSRPNPDAFATAASLLDEQTALLEGSPDQADFVQLDRSFHVAVYQASGYRTALEIVNRLLDLSERYARVYAREATHGRRHSIQEHRRILDACRSGRPEEARQLTEEHIRRGRRELERFVHGQAADDPDGTGAGDPPQIRR